jgi:hypothetical protein
MVPNSQMRQIFMAKLNYRWDEATLNLGQIFMTIGANHDGKLQCLLFSCNRCGRFRLRRWLNVNGLLAHNISFHAPLCMVIDLFHIESIESEHLQPLTKRGCYLAVVSQYPHFSSPLPLIMNRFQSLIVGGILAAINWRLVFLSSGMRATFQNSATLVSIGFFFNIVTLGLASALHSTLSIRIIN